MRPALFTMIFIFLVSASRFVAGVSAETITVVKLEPLVGYSNADGLNFPPAVSCVAFSPDGKYLVSASWDKTIKIFDRSADGFSKGRVLASHPGRVWSLTFSSDGRYLASGCESGQFMIFDTRGFVPIQKQSGLTYYTAKLSFSPDGRYLATGGGTGVKLWENSNHRFSEIQTIHSLPYSPECLSFHPGGRYLAMGTRDTVLNGPNNPVVIWKMNGHALEKVQELRGHTHFVSDVSFSPDGRFLVSGSGDSTIRIWESSGSEFHEFQTWRRHSNTVHSVRFSSDGKYVVSGGFDRTVRIWEFPAGPASDIQEINTLSAGSAAYSVVFNSKGNLLASGNMDGSIDLWELTYTDIKTGDSAGQTGPVQIPPSPGGDQPTEKGNKGSLQELFQEYFTTVRSWAVVIGINKYSMGINGYNELPYAVNDAKDFRNSLIVNMGIPEERIFTLYDADASQKNIEKLLGDDLPKKIREEDRLILYFSGHGETQKASNGEFGYLIPVDGNKENLYSTCISMKQIDDFSNLIPARQILFIVDACYSGIAGILNKSADEEIKKLKQITDAQMKIYMESRGRQVMTAGSSKETARMGARWDNHSVYTYYLLRGLKGEADYDNDGVIRTIELQFYLSTKVSGDTECHQNPQLHSLGVSEGEFIFYREGDM